VSLLLLLQSVASALTGHTVRLRLTVTVTPMTTMTITVRKADE
jgi:hypothetical protein